MLTSKINKFRALIYIMTSSRIILLGSVSDINALNNNRTCAGTILEIDNNQILIDPGIGTVVRAVQANIDLKKTNILLITSSESVYCNDINAVIEYNKNLHLICPKELLKHDESILTVNHAKNLKILSLDKEDHKQTSIKNIDIKAYYNKSDAVSYKITTSKYVLGYITKAKYSKAFVESFKDSNILIINLTKQLTLSKQEKNSKYLDFEEITELIRGVNPELVILNGFNSKIIESDPLEYARQIKQELQKDKDNIIMTQILPAKELMILNPESYNIKLKQKSLNGFIM
jgi:ribonuclease BN (tRNA processing enzyme)